MLYNSGPFLASEPRIPSTTRAYKSVLNTMLKYIFLKNKFFQQIFNNFCPFFGEGHN